MSAPQWKPGDVAMLQFADDDRYVEEAFTLGLRDEPGGWQVVGGFIKDDHWGLTVRRLVVVDAEDREQVERLARAWCEQFSGRGAPLQPEETTHMQAALRSLVTPPKPDEPQGLGAVVEDAEGRRWIRVDWTNPWCLARPNEREPHQQRNSGLGSATHDSHVRWPSVNAVRVLSEGWSE